MLAAGAARILLQDLDEPGKLRLGDVHTQAVGELDLKLVPRGALDPAARGVGMAVREGDVGLDVVDGRAVAQVRGEHVNLRAGVGQLDAVELHAREAQRVRAEGAPRREHAAALGAAEARRAHRGRPCAGRSALVGSGAVRGYVCRGAAGRPVLECPDQPQMAELLEPRHRLRQRELGLEDDAPLQVGREKAVARDAELLRQVRMYACDRSHAAQCTTCRGPSPQIGDRHRIETSGPIGAPCPQPRTGSPPTLIGTPRFRDGLHRFFA